MQEQQLSRINSLRKQLSDLGYHPYQIDSIIRDSIQTTNLNDLNTGLSEQLIQDLEDYIRFAAKCRNQSLK